MLTTFTSTSKTNSLNIFSHISFIVRMCDFNSLNILSHISLIVSMYNLVYSHFGESRISSTLSCDVWLDPVFEVNYPCFRITWTLCKKIRVSGICVKDPGCWSYECLVSMTIFIVILHRCPIFIFFTHSPLRIFHLQIENASCIFMTSLFSLASYICINLLNSSLLFYSRSIKSIPMPSDTCTVELHSSKLFQSCCFLY